MNKKLLVISGIVLMMFFTTITIPVVSEPNEAGILDRTYIGAIGRFKICEDDGNLTGHIFIGFIDSTPVFNLDIEICQDSIKWVFMGGSPIISQTGVYRYLVCAIKE